MPLIEWRDIFSVNVDEIDEQHKVLISLINDLNKAMEQGRSREIIGGIIERMTDYTVMHFSTEEKYFKQFAYPEGDTHREEHNLFIGKVADFKNKFDSGNTFLSISIMNFLRDWLQNHIMISDRKYSRFFNDNGLK